MFLVIIPEGKVARQAFVPKSLSLRNKIHSFSLSFSLVLYTPRCQRTLNTNSSSSSLLLFLSSCLSICVSMCLCVCLLSVCLSVFCLSPPLSLFRCVSSPVSRSHQCHILSCACSCYLVIVPLVWKKKFFLKGTPGQKVSRALSAVIV